jgi:ribosomal-protein-alanine N-acetyltransferase
LLDPCRVTIVSADPSHLPEIAAIEQQLVSPWTPGQIKEELTLAHGWQFVATQIHPPNVLGYIFGSICIDEAEIRKFAVTKEARRQGLGRKLLAHSLSFLQSQNINTCFLELRESNAEALRIYSLFEFKKIGVRKSYYNNPNEHAIILKKQIQPKGDFK